MPDLFRAPLARLLTLTLGTLVRIGGALRIRSAGHDYIIGPRGRWSFVLLPTLIGGEKTPEEIAADEAAEEAARAAAAAVEDDDDDDDDESDDPARTPPEAVFDRDRAMRTIRKQREAERRERERADRAEARLRELEDAQLSEQDKVVKDRDEAKAEAQRQRDRAEKLAVDAALREAALEAGVDPKRIRRALRLVDRDDITITGDDVEGATDAIETLLEDIPELKAAAVPDPEDEPSGEPAGGAPDRRRKPGPLTSEQVKKMIRENPDQFNELFEAGKIPASALR